MPSANSEPSSRRGVSPGSSTVEENRDKINHSAGGEL